MQIKDRQELAELIGKTIHERMVGTGRTMGCYENEADPDVMFARMSAYDILWALGDAGWNVSKPS